MFGRRRRKEPEPQYPVSARGEMYMKVPIAVVVQYYSPDRSTTSFHPQELCDLAARAKAAMELKERLAEFLAALDEEGEE